MVNTTHLKAKLVDVFADSKFSGNGLTIFWPCSDLSGQEMLSLTQEMRQFESIFLMGEPQGNKVSARIFTMEEELDFAGHPILGLAAHLHEEFGTALTHQWTVKLNSKTVDITSEQKEGYYTAAMNQGKPDFLYVLNDKESDDVFKALNLNSSMQSDYPCEVITTGLPYLIVPVTRGIEQAKITTDTFESLLETFGAKFVYILDINRFEGRTWDNAGLVEDIATGSAAGPAAAFLFKAGLVDSGKDFRISQGRMAGRPSIMTAYINSENGDIQSVIISGNVHPVASINFDE